MNKLSKIFTSLFTPSGIIFILNHTSLRKRFSDKTVLKALYKIRTGKKLNLENPETFNEKLQWLKLHDRNPLYTILVDKYEAKEYIAEAGEDQSCGEGYGEALVLRSADKCECQIDQTHQGKSAAA